MFKAVYGKSLAAHIKEHRMELASELLRETGLSIAEIAERVGYENQSKFSAEFKNPSAVCRRNTAEIFSGELRQLRILILPVPGSGHWNKP